MSAPAENYETNVDAAQEDQAVDENKITKGDLDQIDESNIVEGERSNKGGVDNYAEADQKLDDRVGADQ